MVLYLIYALASLAVDRHTGVTIPTVTHLFDQTVFEQTSHLTADHTDIVQVKTAHHVFLPKEHWQTVEGLDGLWLATETCGGIAILIVEIGLGHRAEIVTPTGILDIHDQLCQSPIHFIRLELTTPVLPVLMHLFPMAHHDERH